MRQPGDPRGYSGRVLPLRRLGVLLAFGAASSGCFTVRYLSQAAGGQLAMLHDARPIDDVLGDPQTPPRVRALLARVEGVKDWGQAQGLQPTRNYDRYVDLHRPAAAWIVQACAPLAFQVQRWQFPIVGSVPYLGFFDLNEARRFAAQLAASAPLDVDVRGASAYSTLGWFRDPVLSTMLGQGGEALGDLVNVILHESTHATLYVRNQSAFDESLASFVADRLTLQWLREKRGPESADTAAWVASQQASQLRLVKLRAAYVELDTLYRTSAPEADKRKEKLRILGELQASLGASRPLNNAALAGFKTYSTGTAAFTKLLEACGGRWPRFFAALRRLREEDFGRPQLEAFDDVIPKTCG